MRHTQSHRRLLLALALVATGALSLAQAKTMNSDEQQVAAKQDQAIKQLTKQTDSQSSQSPLQQQQQLVAEKKQGDQAVDSLFNSEEYVQIKPEEINVNGGLGSGFSLGAVGKEVDSAVLALSDLPSSQQSSSAGPQVAEHKSAADDELSAHLAHDTISTLESGVRPYAAPLPQAADPRAARPHHQQARDGYMPPRHPQAGPGYGRPGPRRPYGPPQPPPPPGYIREPRSPARYPPPPQYSQPAGYMSLKGKITDGISSMVVSHPPRPSQTYGGSQQPSPPQAPRYLPRGAAAGYAAFREFVRAQANRYKGQQQPQSMSSHEPVAYNAAMPQQAPLAAGYGSAPGQVSAGESYRPNSNKAPVAYVPEATGPKDPMPAPEPVYIGPSAPRQQVKNKITVAQAYIPHLTQGSSSSAFTQAYGSQQQQQQQQGAQSVSYATNPLLAKLYGGHAPQGVGRPEYNKDYGMVIHYPQATVYTEPMTVDQLHKLAGSSISQILEQLQHNLATGHRDEANTIRANNKHQLGHGLTIHAKEFYAPGKSGNYVPTTAAVISTKPAEDSYQVPPSSSGYSSEMPALVRPNYGGGSQNGEMAASGLKPELGSGYERVKATVAASAMKYGQGSARLQQQQYGPQQVGPRPAYGPEQSSGPAPSLMKPYEPLGAIANIIGSELESLYNKANSVLSKQIDPEFHAHVQAHLKSLSKVASPLKLSEHDYMSPLVLQPHGGQGAQPSNGYGPPPPPPPSYHGPVRPQYQQRPGRGPRRPSGGHPQGGYPRPAGNRYPTAPPGARPYSQPRPQRHPHKNNNYQQQQPSNYNSAEQQAFQQQMNQLLNDFNLGEDNYGAKSQPTQAANQGYPNKVMQKYQQQQQLAGQHPLSYEHVDGLEIPQGPNDQIGEISELIDALKGSLETHKPDQVGGAHSQQPAGARDQGKMEDVRYLASALGQVPSYAIQVPVGPQQQHPPQQYTQPQPQQQYQSGERAVYEAVKKGQEQEQHQQQQYSAPQQQPKQQQYAQPAPAPQALPQQAAPQAYQQQQPAPAAHAQPLPYNAPPAQTHQGAYDQTPVDVPSAYSQQHQPVDYAQQPQAGSHGQYQQQQEAIAAPQQQQNHQQQQQSLYGQAVEAYSSQLDSYANQQQHHHQQQHQQQQQSAADAYGKAVANNRQQAEPLSAPASYAKSGPASAGANSYQQQQASPAAATIEQNQQQPSYSTSEHSQVINHLVPVQQQQQHQPAASSVSASASSSANDYNNIQKPQPLAAITSSISHQPHNQISVAAPTESQYQSAQPLSSFVESLPSDYQELLRQPAGHASILDGASSGHSESYASGASAPKDIIKTAASSSSVSAEVKPVASHHRSSKHDSHHLSGSASSISSTYQQVPSASATSTSSKSAGASSSPSASSSSTSSASSSLAAGRSSSASHPEKK